MAFSYYASITVDNTKVSGAADLTNFPILVSGTYDGTGGEPDLRVEGSGGNVTSASGYDIYFYSDANLTTKLDHQIVSYTSTTGVYQAYVEVPTLDYNDDTVIYMAYGDSGISSDPSTSGTWNTNYKRVWSMHESSGTSLADWSTSNKALTKKAAGEPAVNATGQVYRSQDYDGSDDEATSTDLTNLSLTSGRISAWIYVNDDGENNNTLFSVSNDGGATRYDFYMLAQYQAGADRFAFGCYYNGTIQYAFLGTTDQTDAVNNSWVKIDFIHPGTTDDAGFYMNGSALGGSYSFTSNKDYFLSTVISGGADNVAVGNFPLNGSSTLAFNDKMEMVKVHDSTDSDWMITEYNTENDPSTFYTMGSETAVAGAATPTGSMTTNTKMWGS